MILQENFVKNLKNYRKSCGLTQEKLAELCDTDTSYIGQIETSRRFPSLSFIEKIAEVLQIEPHILFMPSEEVEEMKIEQKEISKLEIKNQIAKMEKELKKLLENCNNLKKNI